jgi:hypothetical protein
VIETFWQRHGPVEPGVPFLSDSSAVKMTVLGLTMVLEAGVLGRKLLGPAL